MSEYRWYVKQAWIGVVDTNDTLLGVIRRSGWVQAVGHFCFIDVSVCGKKYAASGAEDRIYPFHHITLKPGDTPPVLELIAIGWCKDKNTYAFKNKRGEFVKLVAAGAATNNTEIIPDANQPEAA